MNVVCASNSFRTDASGTARWKVTDWWNAESFTPAVCLGDGRCIPGPETRWDAAGTTRASVVVPRSVAIDLRIDGPADEYLIRNEAAVRGPYTGDPRDRESGEDAFRGTYVRLGGFRPGDVRLLSLMRTSTSEVVYAETITLPVDRDLELVVRPSASRGTAIIPFVDADGEPLRGVEVIVRFFSDGTSPWVANRSAADGYADERLVTSDDAGEVGVRIPARATKFMAAKTRRRSLDIEWRGWDDDELAWSAPLELPSVADGMMARTGAVTLGEAPVLASGRVVDESGAPVAGARVSIVIETPDDLSSASFDDASWVFHGRTVAADEAGRFTFRTAKDLSGSREALYLHAELPQASSSELVAFRPGAATIELRLRRLGSIEGRIPERADLPRLIVRLSPASESGSLSPDHIQRRLGLVVDVDASGQFRLPAVPPGSYTLRLSGTRTLATVPDIHVTGGECVRDPRLLPMKWDAGTKRSSILVTSDDGTPVRGATVTHGDFDPGPWSRGCSAFTDAGGLVTIVVVDAQSELVGVWAAGFLPWSERTATFPLTVCLRRSSTLIVRLSRRIDGPAASLLEAAVHDGGDASRNRFVRFGPDGSARICDLGPGRHRLAVGLAGAPPGSSPSCSQLVEIPPEALEHAVTVDVPEETAAAWSAAR